MMGVSWYVLYSRMFFTCDVSRTLFRRTHTHTGLEQYSVVPIPMQVCWKLR